MPQTRVAVKADWVVIGLPFRRKSQYDWGTVQDSVEITVIACGKGIRATLTELSVTRTAWRHEVGARNGAHGLPPHTPAGAESGRWESVLQKVAEFARLGDNWDGCGASRPSPELLASALGLAYVLIEQGVPPPSRVVPGLDGAVVSEWQEPDGAYIDIEIVRPFFAEVMMVEPGRPAKHWTLPTE